MLLYEFGFSRIFFSHLYGRWIQCVSTENLTTLKCVAPDFSQGFEYYGWFLALAEYFFQLIWETNAMRLYGEPTPPLCYTENLYTLCGVTQ